MTNFGINIKKIRSLKNYTQQHLGDILGLTRAAVSSYEEGRAEPKIETLVRASQIFEISVDDLINKKLTINELSKFKIPDIAPGLAGSTAPPAFFPPEATWYSLTDTIIIDSEFDNKQILLAIPAKPDIARDQLIFTDDAVYAAAGKIITADSIVAGPYTIPLASVKKVGTVIGIYQQLADRTGEDLHAELKNIKKRLAILEKKLLD